MLLSEQQTGLLLDAYDRAFNIAFTQDAQLCFENETLIGYNNEFANFVNYFVCVSQDNGRLLSNININYLYPEKSHDFFTTNQHFFREPWFLFDAESDSFRKIPNMLFDTQNGMFKFYLMFIIKWGNDDDKQYAYEMMNMYNTYQQAMRTLEGERQ